MFCMLVTSECVRGMQGRLKSIYSIYKKMIRKKIPVRQVYDARALRIIVDDEGGSRTGDAWAAAYRWAPPQVNPPPRPQSGGLGWVPQSLMLHMSHVNARASNVCSTSSYPLNPFILIVITW